MMTILKSIILQKMPEEKSNNIKRWQDDYLPKLLLNQDLSGSKKFKDDLRRGIPPEIRSEVWTQLIGNHIRCSPILYESLLVRVRVAEENMDKDLQFKKNIKVIEEDLHRTFSDLGIFRFGQSLYQPLKNMLAAFSVFRTDLGYV